jgi:hypothetical protein
MSTEEPTNGIPNNMFMAPPCYPLRANNSGPAYLIADFVNPAPLTDEHVRNCQLSASREELLERLPKGGFVAEIGAETGHFSEIIYAITQPRELALFDLCDQFQYPIRERNGVRFFDGDSSLCLQSNFPDNYFDFIYIDGDHSLEGVWRDIVVAKRKVKTNGFLVFDDYQLFSHYEGFQAYGVVQCVNHLCVTDNWEFLYYAFRSDYAGYDNVAIRRMQMPPNKVRSP